MFKHLHFPILVINPHIGRQDDEHLEQVRALFLAAHCRSPELPIMALTTSRGLPPAAIIAT